MKKHEKNKKHISLLEGSNWQWWGATGSDATFFVQLSQFSSQRCNAPTTSIASVAIYQKRPSYWQFLTSIKKSNYIYQNIYIKYIQISDIKPKSSTPFCFSFHFASSSPEGLTAMSVLKASWPFPERFKYRYLQSTVIQLIQLPAKFPIKGCINRCFHRTRHLLSFFISLFYSCNLCEPLLRRRLSGWRICPELWNGIQFQPSTDIAPWGRLTSRYLADANIIWVYVVKAHYMHVIMRYT